MWLLVYDYLTDLGSKKQIQLPLGVSYFIDRIKASQKAEVLWAENPYRHSQRTDFKLVWQENLVFYRPIGHRKKRKKKSGKAKKLHKKQDI